MNLELYINHLKETGYKRTPQRLKILSYFLEQKNSLVSAKSVMNHLQNEMGKVSFDTVYRNLYLFKNIGILDITSYKGKNLFHLKNEIHTHEHKFICTACKKTTSLDICPMKILDTPLKNYFIHTHKFEIYGLCPSCF